MHNTRRNALKAGIVASVVSDVNGSRLVMRGSNSGQANGFKVEVSDADGNNTDSSGLSSLAYDPTTGAYLSDAGNPATEIGNGKVAATGFDGSAMLQGAGDGIGAVQDLITALTGGLADDVRAAIDGLDDAVDQLSEARTTIGGEMKRADDALEIHAAMRAQLGQLESDLTNVDSIAAYTRLYEVQTAFEAALSVTASSRNQTLFARM